MKVSGMVLCAWVAFLVGCAARILVGSDYEASTDFSTYASYAWEEIGSAMTGDPRLDDNPFFEARVRGAVEQQLAIRGFDVVADEDADLLVHYHMFVQPRGEINFDYIGWELDRRRGYTIFDRSSLGTDVYVNDYDEGMLLVDIADARDKHIVWRGWAQLDVTSALNDREVMDARIRQAVEKVIALFPGGDQG